MPTPTVENYIKRLYAEQQKLGDDQLIPMGRLAEIMAVVPGTATSMVKTLAEGRLVDYEPRSGVRLTASGRALALRVLRRHRIIEAFLVEMLGMDWAEVHDEAEELEHVVSDKVLERLDAVLGRPSVDPHGDPIPSARATREPSCASSGPLPQLPEGATAVVARIVEQEAPFLRFLARHGLTPGAVVTIVRRDHLADSLTVQSADHRPVTLGTSAAAKVLVQGP
jgi:DtxR family Mn-dependent transcriptional regulator